ncbi:YicC family protein [Bacterioplanes sanyensis]|uniref:YicC family protein n=1 Tax=Bacterioplanes sanyensis TaxID=1249553 RepID=A0A222FG43_9GAMM|nr:YicC/YloC family endoribonuclease [Bacterioplanes sanyensis]ASP37709.1 YicC family protein [Bacterioplanes sanyensis]
MTAFARASSEQTDGRFTWEIRSVNSRYLEPHFRLPDAFRELEPKLRERLKHYLSRGKIECALKFQPLAGQSELSVNTALVEQLNQAADQIHAIIGPGNAMNVLQLMQWPGVLDSNTSDSKALQASALDAFESALQQLLAAREREGQALADMIQQRLRAMQPLVAQVREQMPAALQAQRAQLQTRLEELQQQLAPERLEQEMVLLAQKADVAEELDRLDTHLAEVTRILSSNEPIGRRLDFMMQELNREANTLSSKSLTAAITQAAVDLKVLIEQMREQVQNIE